MSPLKPPPLTEAVFLFHGSEIIREMLPAEFDALLDGLASVECFACDRAPAIYALIDSQLSLQALVCFWLDFDSAGVPLIEWNLPLRQLADAAPFKQIRNGQHLRIAQPSNENADSLNLQLWTPSTNHLQLLEARVKRNRLGILTDAPVEPDEGTAMPAEAVLAALKQAHQRQLAALAKQHQEAIEELKKAHRVIAARALQEERAKTKRWHQAALHLQRELMALRASVADVPASSAHTTGSPSTTLLNTSYGRSGAIGE
ncbi:hypothetical protein [Pseudomonas sp. Marseille-QA0892]